MSIGVQSPIQSLSMPNRQTVYPAMSRQKAQPNRHHAPRFGGNPFWKFGKSVLYSAAVSLAAGTVVAKGKKYVDKLTDKVKEGVNELKTNWDALKEQENMEGAKDKGNIIDFDDLIEDDEPQKK